MVEQGEKFNPPFDPNLPSDQQKKPPTYSIWADIDENGGNQNCVTVTRAILQAGGFNILDGCSSPQAAAGRIKLANGMEQKEWNDYFKDSTNRSNSDLNSWLAWLNQNPPRKLEGSFDPSWFTGFGDFLSSFNKGEVSLSTSLHPMALNAIMSNQSAYLNLTTSKKVGLPDPIVINLGDQEGFDTKSLAESDAYFDTNQNGFAEKTGWIGENSGILTRDVNGNGVIDGGAEVFGDSTILSDGTKAATGFDALRDLDSNGDGIISAEDAMYDTLRVWRDDGDGISQSEELKTLSELGIKSISLDSETVNSTDGKGNTITRTSNVEFSDGTIRKAGEFLFNTNTIDTESAATYTGTFEIPDEIKLLPFLEGFSNIDDLHTAMGQNPVLKVMPEDCFIITKFTNPNQPSTINGILGTKAA